MFEHYQELRSIMCSCGSSSGVSSGLDSILQAKQGQAYAQIGVAVLAKSNAATKDQGQAMIELLQSATDMAKQLGKGLQFDARA